MIVPASWLRSFVKPRLSTEALAHKLTMSGLEVESIGRVAGGERVLNFKLTPNRADCLSVLGIAREVAALTGAKLAAPAIGPVPAQNGAKHRVRLTHPRGCGRFAGRVIGNVDAAAPTPLWMRERLERAGQRSISALVDVTNYVMLELGRPLHVYDLDKLKGPIEVRWGKPGERVLLLNEQEVEVDESVLCITDDSGVIGLAGIMGGESTKAGPGTKNIFLESAFFFPEAVAGRARRYNFASDASHRFERGVDFANNVAGIERATRLILEICGGEPGPTVDQVARLPARKPVRMRVERARKVIGVPVTAGEMAAIFRRLGLPFLRRRDAFVVTPPSFRFDLEIEEDLIEEVARLYGFERIPALPPRVEALMSADPEARRSLHELRERLAAADYHEVINFSFVEPAWEADFAGEANPIRLLNPIASQLSVMRSSLIGSLLANLRHNQARKLARIRVFEIGRVYLRDAAAGDGPCAWPPPPTGRRSTSNGARLRARSIFSTSSRTSRRSRLPARRASRRRRTRRFIPGARRACCSRAGPRAGSASCTRNGSRNTSWRSPWRCSSSRPGSCRSRRCPASSRPRSSRRWCVISRCWWTPRSAPRRCWTRSRPKNPRSCWKSGCSICTTGPAFLRAKKALLFG